MPRLSQYPIPKKRFHGGRWRIYWKWNSKQYSIPTSHMNERQVAKINNDLRLVSAALAMDAPVFPDEYSEAPAVLDYLFHRSGSKGLSRNKLYN